MPPPRGTLPSFAAFRRSTDGVRWQVAPTLCSRLLYHVGVAEVLDLDVLDEQDPF